MSDDLGGRLETENEPAEELEPDAEGQEPEAKGEEPEPAELEDEPEGDSEGEGEQRSTQRREARGEPSREQRDRRLSEEERFQREVDRAVERRLSTVRPQHQVDPEAQRRQLQERRQRELDEARLQGPEAYADVRDRHLREDYRADAQAREFRETNQRFQDRYDRLCERNHAYEDVRDEVERIAAGIRQQGIAPDLELIGNNILGKRYAERMLKQGNQQRRNATAETRRQTTRSSSAGAASTQANSRRSGRRSFAELSVQEQERQLAGLPVRTTSST